MGVLDRLRAANDGIQRLYDGILAPRSTSDLILEPLPTLEDVSDAMRKANEPLIAELRKNRGRSDSAGQSWAKTVYGEYYATNVHVYRAVKLRADAVASARLKAFVPNRKDELEWIGENSPLQRHLDHVNTEWSRVDLWRGIETYLSLWGSSFRWLDKTSSDVANWEQWLLRPDKTVIVVDHREGPINEYIRGYIYDPSGARFPMQPDEVIWDRYFNPLDEFAGLSPVAPLRLIADMQADMLSTNKDMFRNGLLTSNLAFLMDGPLMTTQIDKFYELLEQRHSGAGNAQKPIVSDLGKGSVVNLGFSNKEMEFLQGLAVAKEFILTGYGVPEELIPGAEHATFDNRSEARREFYESTIEQEWTLLEAKEQEKHLPMLPARFQNVILKFDRSEVRALQENQDKVEERSEKNLNAGSITINEHRINIGYDPIPTGDVLLIPSSSVPTPVSELGAAPPPAQSGGGSTNAMKDADQLLTSWKSFEKRFDAAREDIHGLMDRLFETQRSEALASLRRTASAARGMDPMRQVYRALPETVFQSSDWLERFIEEGRPFILAALERSAEAQVAEFGLGISFDVTNAATQTWIDERVRFWANRVNEETARLIVDEISAGIANGESVRALEGRVDKVFDFSKDVRSELIARTEAVSASNQGHLEAYRQADVEEKQWLATRDDRVRESHATADGQIVPREQAFLVGGVEMMAPGQGPAKEVANCRCTMVPVLRQRSTNGVHKGGKTTVVTKEISYDDVKTLPVLLVETTHEEYSNGVN